MVSHKVSSNLYEIYPKSNTRSLRDLQLDLLASNFLKEIEKSMQRQKLAKPQPNRGQTTPQIRAHNCIHLCSGDTVGAIVEYGQNFEDTPIVFPSGNELIQTSPSDWVGEKILDVAAMCETIECNERPLVMPVPAMVLADPLTLDACIKATAQTRLCHQEISLELTDAAITLHTGHRDRQ